MEIAIIIGLILINGLFSMSELALVSTRKFKLQTSVKKGHKGAAKALELANNPNTFLSTVQIGITLVGILTGLFSGKSLTQAASNQLSKIELIAPYADSIAVFLVVLLITYLTIVFGELIPKRIGLHYPEAIAMTIAGPMTVLSNISLPLIWILTKTSNLFFRIFGIKDRHEEAVSEEEINAIIRESTEGGEIQPIEQDLVQRVFALGDRRAGELMTHRMDLIWIDISDSWEAIRLKIKDRPHSVYPLCEGSLDKLIGLVSVRELFLQEPHTAQPDLRRYSKRALFVSEYTAAYRVLELLRNARQRYAIVLDEYGDLQGLITLSDLLDELISDHGDTEADYQIIQRTENTWLADGQLPIFEFIQYFDLSDAPEASNFTTLSGLLLRLSDHIPNLAEKIRWRDFELEVVDMDGMRIDKILITRV
ncbi:hemolysin family protein [Olivibacter sp. XZL3]|uniref:hemolysin family protein n=1 Tax=Olivibacter sp. XZL3 TaxID=1735116 RepID=UPI0010667B7E|nr:hemolysin family protein [Olivibacter sp. XZL3]